MEYKQAILINKTKSDILDKVEDFNTIGEAVDSYDAQLFCIKQSKKKYEIDEFETQIDYEIMNMCNMLINKYKDNGFIDKENVYGMFLKQFKNKILIEKIESDETEDEIDVDENQL